jgi:hypothetical protein
MRSEYGKDFPYHVFIRFSIGIFLKFDHSIYENDTSPFGKGGPRGIFQVDSILNPPWPPFFKGGNPFDFRLFDEI